jgi:hypothetical protein
LARMAREQQGRKQAVTPVRVCVCACVGVCVLLH